MGETHRKPVVQTRCVDIKLHGPLPRDTQEVADAIHGSLQSRHRGVTTSPRSRDFPTVSVEQRCSGSSSVVAVSIQPGYTLSEFSPSILRHNIVARRPIYSDTPNSGRRRRRKRLPTTTTRLPVVETLHILCCYRQNDTIQPLAQLEDEYSESARSLLIHKPLYILMHSAQLDTLDTAVHAFRLWALAILLLAGQECSIDLLTYTRGLYIHTLDSRAIRFIMRCSAGGNMRMVPCDMSDSYTRFANSLDVLLQPVNLNASDV